MVQSTIKPGVHKVGFISPPAWFDISPTEFLRIAPKNTIVMQTVMRLPDFNYQVDGVEQFINAVPELRACFNSLAESGADVVTQFGYPFSLAHGWEKANKVQKNIQGTSRTSFVMMGVEIVHAMKHLNCKSIAIASTYYSGKMSSILHEYLLEAGFKILHSENWQSQGIAEDKGSNLFIGDGELDPTAWKSPADAIANAVRNVSKNASAADCILVSGGGMRLLDIAETLEKEVGKPVIGGDLAIYWGILRRLGIKGSVRGRGKLLANLV